MSKLELRAFEVGHKFGHRLAFYDMSPKEVANIPCSNNPINQRSLLISPIWVSLIRKEDKCDLGQVFSFSHVICFCVLVSTSTNRKSWLYFHLTMLFLSNLFYSNLLSGILTCRPILNFYILSQLFQKVFRVGIFEIYIFRRIGWSCGQIMLMCALHF